MATAFSGTDDRLVLCGAVVETDAIHQASDIRGSRPAHGDGPLTGIGRIERGHTGYKDVSWRNRGSRVADICGWLGFNAF